jgi:hypothetical protein
MRDTMLAAMCGELRWRMCAHSSSEIKFSTACTSGCVAGVVVE